MIVLGIESSCDETACGIVKSGGQVLANKLYSQIREHERFGGVVPEIAARAHLEKIGVIVDQALQKAGITLRDVDLIVYTRGPGLMGPLLVGAGFARGLARETGLPCAGINHLEGHLAATALSYPELKPPFLCLTVSGGHTEIAVAEPDFVYHVLGRTRDDAAGEAFDKCGKLLGLDYPAGPAIGRVAVGGKRNFVKFPRALRQSGAADFSFSGLKTSVLRYVESCSNEFLQENLAHIAASLEEAIVDILVEKSESTLKTTGLDTLVVCGGVSANRRLRECMDKMAERCGRRVLFPDFSFCTDNGAMIAQAALMRHEAGLLDLDEQEVVPGLKLGTTS